MIEKFPLLEFSCWSTEQLKGFFHHLPSQFVTFIYTDKDFLSTLRDSLSEGFKDPKDLLQLPEITNLEWEEWKEEGIIIIFE